jgi:hypothetical protein
MIKFQKHFTANLEKLRVAEMDVKEGPRFLNCFMDLTTFLGIKLDDSSMQSPRGPSKVKIREYLS